MMTAMLKQLETPFDATGTAAGRDECTPVAVIGGNAWFAATLEQVLHASGRFSLATAADTAAMALREISGCRDAIVLISARIYDTDIAQTVRRIRQANRTARVVLHLPAQHPGPAARCHAIRRLGLVHPRRLPGHGAERPHQRSERPHQLSLSSTCQHSTTTPFSSCPAAKSKCFRRWHVAGATCRFQPASASRKIRSSTI
jgi:chemotaxis response regulator CheB